VASPISRKDTATPLCISPRRSQGPALDNLYDNAHRNTIKLIAVYARVSTSRQEEERTIETQLIALREFAEHNNLRIVKEYLDDGWSGDILARPELDNFA